ncbi:MAG: hypothetical protein M3Y87_28850 [Myxococcota bacterium]|nr:hypothetical protein [Myxococcota bacterium]
MPLGTWLDAPVPAYGETFEVEVPGQEGDPVWITTLHASGAASGCGGAGRCACSIPRQVAGLCRYAPEPTPSEPAPRDDGEPF